MTHLTPQVRTDKNGRAVIRHMKPEGKTPAVPAPRSFPPVAAPTASISHAETARDIRDIVLSLEKRIPVPTVEYFEGFLKLTHEDSPYIADLMKRVLSTGCEKAQKTASLNILNAVKQFRDGMAHPIDGEMLAGSLMLGWNDENVRHEAGRGERDSLKRSKDAIKADFRNPDPDSDVYWRGLAAARIVYEDTYGGVSLDPSIDFILNRAGAHPDIASVINIAVDRRTLDMDVIEHVINDSKEAIPLRGGVL